MTHRRTLLRMLAALPATACSAQAQAKLLNLFRPPSCGCCCCGTCGGHGKACGIAVQVWKTELVSNIHGAEDVRPCHVSNIDSGRVPADDIRRPIKVGAKARDVALPKILIGSPDMEQHNSVVPSALLSDRCAKTVFETPNQASGGRS